MHQCIVTAHISILTKVPKGLQHTNSYENINIGIISKDIYKNLIITSMHFHETKGQVDRNKNVNPNANVLHTQMKTNSTINRSMSTDQMILPSV